MNDQDNKQGFGKLFLGLWAAVVLFYLTWLIVKPLSETRSTWALLITFGLRSWVTGAVILASMHVEEPRRKRTWRFISVAFVFWTIIDGILATYWLTDGLLPGVPHWIDAVRLGGFLATMVVTFSYPTIPIGRLGRTRDQLDMALIGAAVMGLAWLIFILPILSVRFINPVVVFWRSLFPVFDLLLLAYFTRLLLLADLARDRTNLSLLTLATLTFGASDLIFAVLSLQDHFIPGGVVELGWMLGSGFYYAAAYVAIRNSTARTVMDGRESKRPFARRLGTFLPIGLTGMVIGYLLVDWWTGGQIELVGVALVSLLGILLVARQGVIAGQIELRQYASLVTNSADMAFVCDTDGKLLLVNPALLNGLGLDGQDWEARNMSDLIRSGVQWGRLVVEARESGWSGEVTLRRHDGSTFPAEMSLRPIEDESQTQVVLAGSAHDLTQVKERENALHVAIRQVATARGELEKLNLALEGKVESRTRELEQTVADLARLNQELQDLDKLKTEFVALVSHELRSPLTNISTGIELILSGHPKMKSAIADSLALVQAETSRLSQFVDTILDLSSLEAGRFPLDIRRISLASIAQAACDRYAEGVERGRLKPQIPDNLPQALADEQAVKSVFNHLLDNALKYASEEDIIIEAWCEGKQLRIAVDDGGVGIPENERERIFDMFHRLDASDSRDVYGYGLGLSMVKRLLTAMQGGIRVEESQRGGARFIFWLPMHEEAD